MDSLLQLSDSDLKDMGLATIGARRKLTAAIHRYKLQKMSEDGVEAGGAAAKPRVSAAGSEYVPKLAPPPGANGGEVAKATAASSAAAAAGSGKKGKGDGEKKVRMTHGFVTSGQTYRGRYQLHGKTYIGGSARVVLGEDLKSGQPVAVKVLPSSHSNARSLLALLSLPLSPPISLPSRSRCAGALEPLLLLPRSQDAARPAIGIHRALPRRL